MRLLLRDERVRSTEDPLAGGRGASPEGRTSTFDLLLIMFLVFALMFGVVRPFVAEVFRIPSGSMSPTLEVGDSVLTVKLAYVLGDPARGDLALFGDPEGEIAIKRVVGLPGDTVAIRDGVLYVNGEEKRESYVNYRLTDANFFGPVKVPENRVFLMGDNRFNSRDSRDYGPIPEEDLLGRVSLRIWPLDRAGLL